MRKERWRKGEREVGRARRKNRGDEEGERKSETEEDRGRKDGRRGDKERGRKGETEEERG